jgi:hypothetical protein
MCFYAHGDKVLEPLFHLEASIIDIHSHKTLSTLISSQSACASLHFKLDHLVSSSKPLSLAFLITFVNAFCLNYHYK